MEAATTRARPPEKGTELELTIASMAHGGAGVARAGGDHGYVVFVTGGVPGDRVRAVVTKRKRAYAEARTLEIVEPSPERIAPLADHPGAPWQVLPYERQLAIKQEQVGDALRRIGGFDDARVLDILPAAEQWRYRNKLEFSFGADADSGELLLGFHPPGRWDLVAPMDDCLLASERVEQVRRDVLAWARAQGVDAHDRRTHTGTLRNLVVREGRRTGQLQARLVIGDGRIDTDSLAAAVAVDGLFVTTTDQLSETTMGGVTHQLSGAPFLEEEIAGLRFAISPEAFFQTNTEMAERLYALAAEAAGLTGFQRVFDLFCGIGTIGLTLAPRAGEVFGLEIVEPAIEDAIRNAKANEIANAKFFAGDVRVAMRDLVEQAGKPDVVVVDPPRAGLSAKVVRRIIEAAPKRIVYVSCNPTTLAPNAAQLVEAGFSMGPVQPVDMFPQTPHIECVVTFDRTA